MERAIVKRARRAAKRARDARRTEDGRARSRFRAALQDAHRRQVPVMLTTKSLQWVRL
jgi:hypothetical protein